MKGIFQAISEALEIIRDLFTYQRLEEKVPPKIERAMKDAYAHSEEAQRLDALEVAAENTEKYALHAHSESKVAAAVQEKEASLRRAARIRFFLALVIIAVGLCEFGVKIGRVVKKEDIIYDFSRPFLAVLFGCLMLVRSKIRVPHEKA